MSTNPLSLSASSSRSALLAAAASMLIWGGSGVYFFYLRSVPPLDILAHRITWSAVILGLVLGFQGRFGVAYEIVRNVRLRAVLFGCAVIISTQWGLFIWATSNGRALECGLAYFITPILVVVLASVFLGETMTARTKAALGVLAAGILIRIIMEGTFSWVPLVLSSLFAFYLLLRKMISIDSIAGLFLEMMLLFPFTVAFLIYREMTGNSIVFGQPTFVIPFLVLLCGPFMTALPMVLLNVASNRLRLSTLGLIQYSNPMLQVLAAVLIIGEPLTIPMIINFIFVWIGLLIYSTSFLGSRGHRNETSS